MASTMRPFAAANLMSLAGRRAYTTSRAMTPRPSLIANRAQWTPRPVQHQIALRQTIRRATTDANPPKPRRRFRLLRWTWRLTYLSAIAGLGYVGYGIYEVRNPHDQPEPDPSKKTLVVLGMQQQPNFQFSIATPIPQYPCLSETMTSSDTTRQQVPVGAPSPF
jgi:NADH:ubiquinone reductase (non-electrogenic)